MPYANIEPKVVPEELADEQVLFLIDVLPTSYWGIEIGGVKKGNTVVVLDCVGMDGKMSAIEKVETLLKL